MVSGADRRPRQAILLVRSWWVCTVTRLLTQFARRLIPEGCQMHAPQREVRACLLDGGLDVDRWRLCIVDDPEEFTQRF